MDNQSMIKLWLRFSHCFPADRGRDSGEPIPRRLVQCPRWHWAPLLLFDRRDSAGVLFWNEARIFLWWEYLGFFACVVSIVVARDWLVQIGANRTLVALVAQGMIFGCFICLHHAVRMTGKAARPWAGRDPS